VPAAYQPRPLVYPRLIVTDIATGVQYVTPLGAYSPGWDSWSKPEPVPRKRPSNLKDFSSLTAWGVHNRNRQIRSPVTVVYPPAFGTQVTYEDIDPQMFVSVGAIPEPPVPDWQTALRLAVKDQKVNLAQSLAEYKQAQNMFASNGKAIANAFLGLLSGNKSQVFKSLGLMPKQLHGTIAIRYGWMPLIQDLHGAAQELEAALQRPQYRKINTKTKVEDRQKYTIYIDVPRRTRTDFDAQWNVSAKVIAYCKQESLAACRLGLTNPINLVWELIPYSFVLDWIIPIGNWLNSLDAGVGLIEIYGTVTTRSKMIATETYGNQYYLQERYSRVPFWGLPAPPLPRYDPSIGVGRVANALALLSQAKRKVSQTPSPPGKPIRVLFQGKFNPLVPRN